MKLNSAKVPFGHHESFPLRFGWITKRLTALQRDPNVFACEDATGTLGVGKNEGLHILQEHYGTAALPTDEPRAAA